MSDAWKRAQESAERHAEKGGIFVRLKNNGDKVIGAFCGDPYAKEVVWTGQKYEEYDAGKPEHKSAKQGLRVGLNFFVPAENSMKVIEGSAAFFKTVVKVKDKYGVENWLFEIERQGEAGDPKTKYSILPEKKLSAEVRAQIGRAKLHDLDALAGEGGDGQAAGDTEATETTDTPVDGPISEQDAQGIVECLKSLPKSDVSAFLDSLKVQRVRDLKSSQVAEARSVLSKIEDYTFEAEVDPFA